MTEYQKIENELTTLGWTHEQGSGDHMKFTKNGNPHRLIVSMSINAEGRALKNTYADIRRVEPHFSLGRQPHMLPRQEQREDEAGEIPGDVPEWMWPDKPVRWTKPENRDWSRLDDPASVMNRQYTVTHYQVTDDGTMAFIRDGETDKPFAVFIDELDMWPTLRCPRCGKAVPKNWLVTGDDGTIRCEDCNEESLRKDKDVPAAKEPVRKTPLERIAENDPALQTLIELTQEYNANKENLQEEEKKAAANKFALLLPKLSSKAKKALRKDLADIIQFVKENTHQDGLQLEPGFVNQDRKGTVTPYDAWRRARADIVCVTAETATYRPEFFGADDEPTEAHEDLRRRLSRCKFDVTKLKDRRMKRKAVGNIVTVTAPDLDTTLTLYRALPCIFHQFEPALPDLPTYVLLTCPQEGVRQYLFDTAATDYKAVFALLQENLPTSETKYLDRAKAIIAIPPAPQTYRRIIDTLKERGLDIKDGKTVVMIGPDILPYGDGTFEHALATYRFFIDMKCEDNRDAAERLVRDWTAQRPVDAPVVLGFRLDAGAKAIIADHASTYRYPDQAYVRPEDGAGEGEPAPEGERTLITISEHPDKGIQYTAPRGGRTAGEYRETLAKALLAVSQTDDPAVSGAFLKAFGNAGAPSAGEQTGIPFPETAACGEDDRQTDNNDNNENSDTMNEHTYLDQCNPASENPMLATATTRDLLKELKARGVEFDNLTITLRKTISMDEI